MKIFFLFLISMFSALAQANNGMQIKLMRDTLQNYNKHIVHCAEQIVGATNFVVLNDNASKLLEIVQRARKGASLLVHAKLAAEEKLKVNALYQSWGVEVIRDLLVYRTKDDELDLFLDIGKDKIPTVVDFLKKLQEIDTLLATPLLP